MSAVLLELDGESVTIDVAVIDVAAVELSDSAVVVLAGAVVAAPVVLAAGAPVPSSPPQASRTKDADEMNRWGRSFNGLSLSGRQVRGRGHCVRQ
jgi:hypothetical protein